MKYFNGSIIFTVIELVVVFFVGYGMGGAISAGLVALMTIKLVDDQTLETYSYLEHGAFWAIGALSLIMFIGVTGHEVPEVVSGLVGIAFIGLSFWSSIRQNKIASQIQPTNA